MFYRRSIWLALVCSLVLTSCSTLITAYLISQLLNDKAPKRTWSGVVHDTTGQPVGGVDVTVIGQVEGDVNLAKFAGNTDTEGHYAVRFRYNKNVSYSVQVSSHGVVLANEEIGTIEVGDRVTDFIIQGAVSVELAGIVRGPDGNPIKGAVVVGASASALDATPIVLLGSDSKAQYEVTNDSGVYQLTGSIAKYGVVCAYHPDHGFAYAYGEDTDKNGSIALNIDMGASGDYAVHVQVVDGSGTPISQQVLPPARQFRLRLYVPFNLSPAVNDVVADNGLFPGLVGKPGDTHPETVDISVQATGLDGIADTSRTASGGNYSLRLLNISDDNQPTALVQSANPLVLYQDSTVIVRVN